MINRVFGTSRLGRGIALTILTILVVGLVEQACAPGNTTTVVYVTPAPSVAPQATGQLLPPAIKTAEPTTAPTTRPAPAPTAAPATDPSFVALLQWITGPDYARYNNDFAAFADCLQSADCSVGQLQSWMKVVATDDGKALAWLKANPPDACYHALYADLVTAFTEEGMSMSALNNYFKSAGDNADLRSANSHMQNAADALGRTSDDMDTAAAACGA